MTKKSRCQAGLQVPRKLGLDIEKCQTLPRSKRWPTTADAESVWSVAREIVKAAARLSLYVLARVAFWAVFAVLLLPLVDHWFASR